MFKGQAPLTAVRPTEPWPGKGPCNIPHPRVDIAIVARVNFKHVCAESNGQKPLVSNRDNPGPWERFTFETVDIINNEPDAPLQSRVRIKACNGKYVSIDLNHEKSGILIATADHPGDNETFVLTDDGQAFTLLANNGKYVQASDGGSGPLVAWAAEGGWWESFEFVD
jgi:hypothetical protein